MRSADRIDPRLSLEAKAEKLLLTMSISHFDQVVGFKNERHKPWYSSLTPLDARCFPTFN
jgi:hypothetical protein